MIIDTILYGQKVVLVPYKAEHVSVCLLAKDWLYFASTANALSLDIPWMDGKWIITRTDSQWSTHFRGRVRNAKCVAFSFSLSLLISFSRKKNGVLTKIVSHRRRSLNGFSYLCNVELTFIILARTFDANADLTSQPLTGDDVANLPMVGDVNLFLKGIPPQMRATAPKPNTNKTEDAVEEEEEEENFEAELEIMIAGSGFNPFLSSNYADIHKFNRTCLPPTGSSIRGSSAINILCNQIIHVLYIHFRAYNILPASTPNTPLISSCSNFWFKHA